MERETTDATWNCDHGNSDQGSLGQLCLQALHKLTEVIEI